MINLFIKFLIIFLMQIFFVLIVFLNFPSINILSMKCPSSIYPWKVLSLNFFSLKRPLFQMSHLRNEAKLSDLLAHLILVKMIKPMTKEGGNIKHPPVLFANDLKTGWCFKKSRMINDFLLIKLQGYVY